MLAVAALLRARVCKVVPRPLQTWISLLERLRAEESGGLEPLEDLLSDLRRWARELEREPALPRSELSQRFPRLGSQPTAPR